MPCKQMTRWLKLLDGFLLWRICTPCPACARHSVCCVRLIEECVPFWQRVEPEVQRYWEGVLENVTKPTAKRMLETLDPGRLLGLPVIAEICICATFDAILDAKFSTQENYFLVHPRCKHCWSPMMFYCVNQAPASDEPRRKAPAMLRKFKEVKAQHPTKALLMRVSATFGISAKTCTKHLLDSR